jgi:hypothetical protein
MHARHAVTGQPQEPGDANGPPARVQRSPVDQVSTRVTTVTTPQGFVIDADIFSNKL